MINRITCLSVVYIRILNSVSKNNCNFGAIQWGFIEQRFKRVIP